MPAAPPFTSLDAAADWYGAWLREGALPLWSTAGVDGVGGGFQEALCVDGHVQPGPRRGRVHSRQAWVFATADLAGLGDQWREVAKAGFAVFLDRYRRPDGLFVRLAAPDGAVLDPTPMVYDQAFSLLAMSSLFRLDPSQRAPAQEAQRTLAALDPHRAPAGGYREAGERPFQANAHMHLLEASLAWEDTGELGWAALSDEIVGLALDRFIDAERGLLREFFDADWRPLTDEGGLVEPGHQFEWAWLLERWGLMRGRADAREVARRLFANGLVGVDPARGVAVNALWEDLSVRDSTARLWPQTEYLKAALLFGSDAQALAAAQGLAGYLDTPARGAWRDRMAADGSFVDEPAPATSFYHLLGAVLPLLEKAGRL